MPNTSNYIDAYAGPTCFADILEKHALSYQESGNYLLVGKITPERGWIIHISVIRTQLEELLDKIIPLLAGEVIPFRVAKDMTIAKLLLSGRLGLTTLGKVVAIYPNNNTQALYLAKELIDLTASFKGPNILTDRQLGNVVYTQYSLRQDWGSDEGNIPFTLPTNVEWPFSPIVSSKIVPHESFLNKNFKTPTLLKRDAKGDVIKALWTKEWQDTKWCVIKEGKYCMNTDMQGRDMKDRLNWQFEIHKALEKDIPLPQVYNLFEENQDSYLVMEYIEGVNLTDITPKLFKEKTWLQLPLDVKHKLLDYAHQILNIIETIHQKGYVHRDVTPANFLVDKNQCLWVIDMELAYSFQTMKPTPPIRGGTQGFTSPEHWNDLPSPEQDIYSIGCLLIYLLTSLLPNKFTTDDQEVLKKQLSFQIPDPDVVECIAGCFAFEPAGRPSITSLQKSINFFKERQHLLPTTFTHPPKNIPHHLLEDTINHVIEGLAEPPMVNSDGLWISKRNKQGQNAYYQDESTEVYADFDEGISGISYTLALVKQSNFSIDSCLSSYEKGIKFIRKNNPSQVNPSVAGLYTGTTGIVMALTEGIKGKLIADNQAALEIQSYISNNSTTDFSIATGIAGLGLAVLRAAPLLDQKFVDAQLDRYVLCLLRNQQENGSWLTDLKGPDSPTRYTGFSLGNSGIICFLLGYISKYQAAEVESAVQKALRWLINQSFKTGNIILWPIHDNTKQTEFGMLNGVLGITLTLVKAYDILGDSIYRKIAEDILERIPSPIVIPDFTLATGLSGIGELYLEAARAFESDVWKSKADWLIQLLVHHIKQSKDGSCYWMTNNDFIPTAGLLTGCSGVLHFLMRFYNDREALHPLLSF